MIQVFNKKMKHLLRGEEGFAMALTLIVYPVLLIMVGGVFVYGEIARQKIHFQNAADAASYAGAVVQADTLSRIAVLNKVMAWTYVQANKMEMDYVVNDWLTKTANGFNAEKESVKAKNEASVCNHPKHRLQRSGDTEIVVPEEGKPYPSTSGYGYYIGWDENNSHIPDLLKANGKSLTWSKDIYENMTLYDGSFSVTSNGEKSFIDVQSLLDGAYQNIAAMNTAINDLKGNSKSRIDGTVRQVLSDWGVTVAENANFAPDGADYLLSSTNETDFLAMSGESTVFDNYSWWTLNKDASGIQRKYNGGLSAEFNSGYVKWGYVDNSACEALEVVHNSPARKIEASDVYGSSPNKVGAYPVELDGDKMGVIKVDFTQSITIPLVDFIKAPAKLLGIDFTAFDALTVKCSSAARACPKGTNGYTRTLPAGIIKETDWNAVWFAE